jgi:hypothetical protein
MAYLRAMTHAPTDEFAVLFLWPEGQGADVEQHPLEALTLEQAKMQAAMLYAGAAFKTVPPTAYAIMGQFGEAYRYPPALRAAI